VILASAWRSAEQETAVPGQADHPHVVAEVLAAELRADSDLAGDLQYQLLQIRVAEAVAGG
jgi:hypothetical protein